MTITVVFDPPLPSDSPATFNTKAFSTLGDLNDWSTQANALAVEVNADEAALAAAVSAASGSASTASSAATAASGSATSAGTSATTASGAAATATTKASEASASATAAATSAADAAATLAGKLNAANPSYTGGLTGDTGVINIGSGQVYKDASGNVGFGTASPVAKLDARGSATDFIAFNGLNENDNAGVATSSALRFGFTSTIGTHYATLKLTEESNNDNSGSLSISLPAGGVESVKAVMNSAGNLTLLAGTMGYGPGAGGTATQPTSKATTVALNKPSGQITMNASALAAGATEVFALSNTFISEADLVSVTINRASSGASYTAWLYFTGSGVAYIAIKNISGGSLSEAVVLNFSVKKGSTT